MIRIRRIDSFEGSRIVDFTEGVQSVHRHTLTAKESAVQGITRTLWNQKLRAYNKANKIAGVMEWKSAFKQVADARLGIVHELCLKYRYGEEGDSDGALGEDTAHISPENIVEVLAKSKKKPANKGDVNRVLLRAATKQGWRSSSRVVAFVNLVQRHFQTHGEGSKILVFADFLSALDVAENALLEVFANRVRIARFDGTVDAKTRAAYVKEFEEAATINVFLITTKAGGCGLTLTKANGVYILTQPWSPSAALQCIARAVRIGTKHTVYVYVLYAHNSIERRVMLVQKIKLRKASKVVDPDTPMMDKIFQVGEFTHTQLRDTVSLLNMCCVQRADAKQMEGAKEASKAYAKRLEKRLAAGRPRKSARQDDIKAEDILEGLPVDELVSAEAELEKDFQELVAEDDDIEVDADLLADPTE